MSSLFEDKKNRILGKLNLDVRQFNSRGSIKNASLRDFSIRPTVDNQEREKECYELTSSELLIKIDNALFFKFMRPIRKMFSKQPSQSTSIVCVSCKRRFGGWLMGLRRKVCGRCQNSFCPDCLQLQIRVDCSKATLAQFEDIQQVITSSGNSHSSMKKQVSTKLCNPCFKEATLIFKQFLKILNRRYSGLSMGKIDATFSNSQTASPTYGPRPFNMKGLAASGGNLSSRSSLDQSLDDEFSPKNQGRKSPLQYYLSYISQNFSPFLAETVRKKLLFGLEQITPCFNTRIDLFNYAKIYDLTTESCNELSNIDIISVNGTLMKKLIRHRKFQTEENLPGVLLLSLPINFSFQFTKGNDDFYSSSMESKIRKQENSASQSGNSAIGPLMEASGNMGTLTNMNFGSKKKTTSASKETKEGMDFKESRASQLSSNYIPLEKLGMMKSQLCSGILNIVKKGNVKVVFCTEAIPHQLFEALRKIGVVTIFPVTISEMEVISKTVNASIISDSDIIRKLEHKNASLADYVGQVTTFKTWQRYMSKGELSHIVLLANDDNNIESAFSLGFLVVGNDETQNHKVREFLRSTLKQVYYLITERRMMDLEREIFLASNLILSVQPIPRQIGSFHESLIKSNNINQLLKMGNKLMYTKVTLISATKENTYNDFQKKFGLVKKFHEYIMPRLKTRRVEVQEFDTFIEDLHDSEIAVFSSLNLTKVDFIATNCEPPQRYKQEPFGSTDITLLGFIKSKVEKADESCWNCKRKWQDHTNIYYIGKASIRSVVEDYAVNNNTIKQNSISSSKNSSLMPIVQKESGSNLGFHRENMLRNGQTTRLSSFVEQKLLRQKERGSHNLFSMAKKAIASKFIHKSNKESEEARLKKEDEVQTFINCQHCGQMITEIVVVPSKTLNCSLMMYLYNFQDIWNYEDEGINLLFQKSKTVLNRRNKIQCRHQSQQRCFTYKQKLLSLQRIDLNIFRVLSLDFDGSSIPNFKNHKLEYQKVALEKTTANFEKLLAYSVRQSILVILLLKDVVVKYDRRVELNSSSISIVSTLRDSRMLKAASRGLVTLYSSFGRMSLLVERSEEKKHGEMFSRDVVNCLLEYSLTLSEIYRNLFIDEVEISSINLTTSMTPNASMHNPQNISNNSSIGAGSGSINPPNNLGGSMLPPSQSMASFSAVRLVSGLSKIIRNAIEVPPPNLTYKSQFKSDLSVQPLEETNLEIESINMSRDQQIDVLEDQDNLKKPELLQQQSTDSITFLLPPNVPTTISGKNTVSVSINGNQSFIEQDSSNVILPSSNNLNIDKYSFMDSLDAFIYNDVKDQPIMELLGIQDTCFSSSAPICYDFREYQKDNKLAIYARVLSGLFYRDSVINKISKEQKQMSKWLSGSLSAEKFSTFLKNQLREMSIQDFKYSGCLSALRASKWHFPLLNVAWEQSIRIVCLSMKKLITESSELASLINESSLRVAEGLQLDLSPSPNNRPQNDILSATPQIFPHEIPQQEIFKLSNIFNYESILRLNDLSQKLFSQEDVKFDIIVHHPLHFQIIREVCGYKHSEFVISNMVATGFATSGGKTKSEFLKTDDGRFIAKTIEEVEFQDFKAFIPNYTRYVTRTAILKRPTVLSKILGLFEVKVSNESSKYLIVMENIFYGLKDKNLKTYDLKGSQTNRLGLKDIKGQTLLDTNFRLERNGDPLTFVSPNVDFFQALENDSNFLSKQNVIDYSLFLVIGTDSKTVKVGIIDYLREYDLKKRFEELYKRFRGFGTNPTIVAPDEYKSRFLTMMEQYFVEIDHHQYGKSEYPADNIFQMNQQINQSSILMVKLIKKLINPLINLTYPQNYSIPNL